MRTNKIFLALKWMIITIVIVNCHPKSFAQIFPGLEGEELVIEIRNSYTPQQLLNDTQVKDTLYARIFIEGDTVKCIYSDLPRFLPEGVDPSQFLFGSGNEIESINMEHGWPQAKGAGDGTDGNTNMHHLYPSRGEINSDRGNFPFSEINDNTTQKWYYLGQEMSTIPGVQIDEYSEFISGQFEPREDAKGDIARAMFYFWTIYRDDAVAADPDFFNLQVDDLCQWHLEDPADGFEMLRNERISNYQDGKINPFIADCSLVKRAYCNQLPACSITSIEQESKTGSGIIYDSAQQKFLIRGEGNKHWRFYLVNLIGQVIYAEDIRSELNLPSGIQSGFYIAFAFNSAGITSTRIYIP